MLNRSPKALGAKIVDRIEGDLYNIDYEKKKMEKTLSIWKMEAEGIIARGECGLSYKAFFDGGSTPNPGQMKIGGYIEEPHTGIIYEYSEDIGYGTNNEAEYSSLLYLCKALVDHEIWKVIIHGDSSLIVNQVNGVFKARHVRMVQLRDEVREVLKGIKGKWKLVHVPRNQNKKADSLT